MITVPQCFDRMSVFEGKADIPVDRALIGENTENPLRQGKEIIVLDLKTRKAGATPSRIARQLGICQSDARRVPFLALTTTLRGGIGYPVSRSEMLLECNLGKAPELARMQTSPFLNF